MSLTTRLCQIKSRETLLQTLEMVCTVKVYTVHVIYRGDLRDRCWASAVSMT